MVSSGMVKVACVVLMCMVVTAPQAKAAVTCDMVITSLAPCLNYLMGGGPVPGTCCSGVQYLYGVATTTTDRQEACKCMKSTADRVTGLNLSYASTLPAKCGVNIPYKISLSTDCAKVQ